MGRAETLYGNGELKSFETYLNGVPNGPYISYCSESQIDKQYDNVNRQIHGDYVDYFPDGKIFSKGRYINGEKEGLWVQYHNNGNLMSKGSYKNSKREGIWESYFLDGTLESEKLYKNGDVDPSFVSTKTITKPCPNLKALKNYCMFIENLELTAEYQGETLPRYKAALYDAACVDLKNDSEETIGKKVATLINIQEDAFKCIPLDFLVRHGNIFKYAVQKNKKPFIYYMIDLKVNLNRVDKVDGKTVLDFISDMLESLKGKGFVSEGVYKNYYDLIRKAGGKHAHEL